MAILLKRMLDTAFSMILLVIFSPVMLVVSLLVRISVGKPVFFVQKRPGFRAKPFYLIKFRTMTNECDNAGRLLTNEKRLTPLGRFLRSTSLDEIPQLINVLRGEMSLVGPRPLRMHYLDRYTEGQARRHDVRPGITGWAQVNGRNTITWEEKFILDVWYVDNWSLFLDLKILWLTLVGVIKREGVNFDEFNTMPEFMGTKKL